jgi:hypothetical protein
MRGNFERQRTFHVCLDPSGQHRPLLEPSLALQKQRQLEHDLSGASSAMKPMRP